LHRLNEELEGVKERTVIERIGSLPRDKGGETPVVALTAYAAASDREKLLHAGFHRHVPKPFQPPDLLLAVAALVRSSESAHKLASAAQAASETGR